MFFVFGGEIGDELDLDAVGVDGDGMDVAQDHSAGVIGVAVGIGAHDRNDVVEVEYIGSGTFVDEDRCAVPRRPACGA